MVFSRQNSVGFSAWKWYGFVPLVVSFILVPILWNLVEKRRNYKVLKISLFSGAGNGGGVWPEKMTEYSVSLDGIFLTALTASVRFNGIFLTALTDAVSVPGTCLHVADAWGRVRRWKFFLKIWGCSWGWVDHVGVFIHPIWALYEKLFRDVGYVF